MSRRGVERGRRLANGAISRALYAVAFANPTLRVFFLGLTAGLLAWPLWAAEPPVAAQAMALAREAATAADAGDKAGYLAKMEGAVALRTDFPRMLVNLAAAQLANDHADDAIATLEKLAALGAHSPVEKSAEFAALRGQKEFSAIVKNSRRTSIPRATARSRFRCRA